MKIKKVNRLSRKLNGLYTPEVTYYNNCYYICLDKKPLKKFANELKEQWLNEVMERVELIKRINV